jgi:hypothetical protein
MFVNEETYLVVSNLTNEPYTLKLDGIWQDRVTNETASCFEMEHRKLLFLKRL